MRWRWVSRIPQKFLSFMLTCISVCFLYPHTYKLIHKSSQQLSLKCVHLVVLHVSFHQMVKTEEQRNFLSNTVWTGTNLDLPKTPYIHVLGWVFTGGDSLSHTVSRTDRAWGMIFKFIRNSDQLWQLQKIFTWFLGITLSAKLRGTLFHTTYFLKPCPA